jgi:phenylalanyl-tRNA synthetase beta chain
VREPVRVRASRIAKLLGIGLSIDEIADVFVRLNLAFARDGDTFVVTPPSHRFDLAIEEDFVEEVARIHGYDAIPAAPAAHVQHMLPSPEGTSSLSALKARLVDRDWNEIVTFGFVSGEVEAALDPATGNGRAPVKVMNPIAAPLDVMRRSLLPGLIGALLANVSRREPRVRLFEAGRVFLAAEPDVRVQPIRLGGLALGTALPEQWGVPQRPVDFFDVKGDVEALVHPRRVTTDRAEHPALHPGRSARVRIDGVDAGWLGELHPRLVRRFELPQAPVAFELDVAALAGAAVPQGKPVSKLPIARRDIAVVVPDDTPAQALLDAARSAAPPFVETVRVFDVYRGAGLPSGRKSVAILVLMQDTARTLTEVEIDAAVAAMVRALEQGFGATLRTQGAR